MAKSKKYTVRFRRKRKGLTNYKKRLGLLKSGERRLVIRKSLNNLNAQIVEFSENGDRTMVNSNTKDLVKFGWKAGRGNVPAAYLAGFLLGIKAKKKNIEKAIADFGLQNKGLRLYACLKGAIDAGMKIPCSEAVLSTDEIIKGKIIIMHKEMDSFLRYKKNNLNVEDIGKHLEEVRKRIKENA